MELGRMFRLRGPGGLSDSELWQLVLSSSSAAEAVAQYVPGLDTISVTELQEFPNVGTARAARVAAVVELGRRYAAYCPPGRPRVMSAADVHQLVSSQLHLRKEERFLAIALNARHRVLQVFEVAQGYTNGVEVHPREVFRPLIREAAAAAIFAHNHPSGDPTPSQDDLYITSRLKEVGKLIGIKVLDHVVVGDAGYVSLAEEGAL